MGEGMGCFFFLKLRVPGILPTLHLGKGVVNCRPVD